MNPEQGLREALHGVGITPTTPFSDDLTGLDSAGLRANLEFLVRSGARLLYPAGNTGEVMSLSPSEWTTVVETALDVAGDEAVIVPGVGHELPVAIELARRASSLGAHGILLMPRDAPYATSEGVVSYWRALLEATDLPVVVYKRGLPADGHLAGLVAESQIVGCKYAGSDAAAFSGAVGEQSDAVVWTCGSAERYATFFWSAGARGFTSGLANFAPGLALGLYDALASGDYARADEIRARCVPIEDMRARNGSALNVGCVKAAMDLVDRAGGRVRPPLRDLDQNERAELREIVDEMLD